MQGKNKREMFYLKIRAKKSYDIIYVFISSHTDSRHVKEGYCFIGVFKQKQLKAYEIVK